jgi:biopolymer transport protein ExbD
MAFDTGGGGGLNASINVTPMIDVLLVLLIVFMVITPVTPKGLTTVRSWSRSRIAQAVEFRDTRSMSWTFLTETY